MEKITLKTSNSLVRYPYAYALTEDKTLQYVILLKRSHDVSTRQKNSSEAFVINHSLLLVYKHTNVSNKGMNLL